MFFADQVSVLVGSRYALHNRLGAGGMGAVYRATDLLTGQTIALKRVYVNTTGSSSDTNDPRLALAREFRTLASLHHPHIINVLDYGFDEDRQPYFAMNLLPKPQTIREAAQNLDVRGKIRLLIQTLQALAYMHRRGIVHRDLKPANILVHEDEIRIVDFGLATESGTADDTSGTLAYMAPELLRGLTSNQSTDLYAIGVIAYELFAGQHPFHVTSISRLLMEILQNEPDLNPIPDQDLPVGASEHLRKIIGKLLAKTSAERYQDANLVIQDLSVVIGQPVPEESEAIRESFLQAANFVGREQEFDTLSHALDSAIQGRGSTWLVGGESGVGKSRLIDEIRIQALVKGVTVLRGQAVTDGKLPYRVWRDAVRRLILSTHVSDLEAAILKEIVPDIDQLLNRVVPEVAELDEKSHQQRLILTIIQLFQRQSRPILFITEDLQWSTESIEGLKLLTPLAASLPLLIVGSYRDDERPTLPRDLPAAQVMKLHRLNDNEILELSTSMLGEVGKKHDVIDLLQRETEGNVFFLIEVVRTLAEDAGSLQDIGRMTLPSHVFSGGVKQVVQRRLTRVPEEARTLLKLAAVTGRQLDLNILQAALIAVTPRKRIVRAEDLDDWLTTCANIAVLELHDGVWRFAHDKLREGLLEDITGDERPALHQMVAEAIETAYPDDNLRAASLVKHWHEAGDTAKEAIYAYIAGEQSHRVSDFKQALDYFKRVLEISNGEPIAAAVLADIGEIYVAWGDYHEAQGYFNSSLELSRLVEDKSAGAKALLGLGEIAINQSRFHDAEYNFAEALANAYEIGDRRFAAKALSGLGHVASDMSETDTARDFFIKSKTIELEIGSLDAYADTLNDLGILAYKLSDYDTALRYHEESAQILRQLGDRMGLAKSLHLLGSVWEKKADFQKAGDYYKQSLAIQREIGDKRGIARSLTGLGVFSNTQGKYKEAQAYYEECLVVFRALGHRRNEGTILMNLGNVAMYLGNYDLARNYHLQSLSVLEEARDEWGVAYVYNNLGRAAFNAGNYTEALEYHERSLDMKKRIGDRQGIAYSLCDASFAWMKQGDLTHVRPYLNEALQIAWEVGSTNIVIDAFVGFARIGLLEGRLLYSGELIGMIETHPALHAFTRLTHLQPLRAELEQKISHEELESALQRGAACTLEAVVQQHLLSPDSQ